MPTLVIGFIVGAIAGSAATALADRYDRPREFLIGRSSCPHCHAQLRWFELIPIISWLTQRGQCRSCRWPIGVEVLAVEVGSAIVGAGVASQFGLGWLTALIWIVLVVLGALIIVDIAEQQLPDRLILVSLPFLVAIGWLAPTIGLTVPSSALGILVGGGFLLLLWFVTKGRGIGLGDVKLASAFGLGLGYPIAIVMLFAAFMLGGAWSIGLLATGRAKFGQQVRVPFGPFLILGYFVALLAGRSILTWYGLV